MSLRPFENLREQLRAKGCLLQCVEQVRVGTGSIGDGAMYLELWSLRKPEGARSSFMVIDEGRAGYRLFIENQTLEIAADVAALLGEKP